MPGQARAEVRERKRRFRIAIPPRHWLRFRANVKRAREVPGTRVAEDRGKSGGGGGF